MGKQSREKRERRLENNNEIKKPYLRSSSLESVYFYIIEWGTYLALFTPLIMIRSFFFPFVSPKTIFFRIVVDIIFIAYILLAISNRKYLPKFNALVVTIVVFLAILVLTSFTGINFERSFWSVFERMTGLLTFFHLLAFFIVLISVFKERKYWERILTVSILVGIIVSFIVLTSSDPSSRGGATLGNTSFMSAYLLFDIFFAIIMFFGKTGWWRLFYGSPLILFIVALFFNKEPTRGAIGALFGGIFILILGYMIFSGKKLLKRLAPVFAVLTILAVMGFTQTTFFKTKIMDVRELPGPARKIVWQIAIESWKEKPWLGWGWENFNVPFTENFNPAIFLSGDIWYDRVHSIVLDTLVTSGIVGFISYLAIFGVAIFELIRLCPKIVEKRNIFFPLGMTALLVVYFLQNIWVFDMISSYMMFFLSLAFIFFLTKEKKEEENLTQRKNPIFPILGAILIILAVITLWFGNIQLIRVSTTIITGIASPLEQSISAFQKVIKMSPIAIFEAPEQFSRKMSGYISDQNQNKELLIKGFEASAEELKEGILKNPQDFRYYLNLGRQYNDFYQLTGDGEKLKEAENFLEKAIGSSSKNQQGYWALAQTKVFEGKTDEVVQLLQKAIDLEPRYAISHWYLAMIYKMMGKNDLALQKVKDAEKAGLNWKANLDYLKNVIEIYQNLGDDKELINLYPLAIEMDSEDARLRAGLAVAYANLGQFEDAKKAAREAIGLSTDPAFTSQLENFLKQLPQ